MKLLNSIRWFGYNAYRFIDAWRRQGLRKLWMKHGYTAKLREGGTLHFATYKEMAESLSVLYGTKITDEMVRNCIRFNKPLTIKVDIATITKRKED